jgi:hypothetical protein
MLLAHYSCYCDGWALPFKVVYNGKTHHFSATLWETHPSSKLIKDLLLERMNEPDDLAPPALNDSQPFLEKELSEVKEQIAGMGLRLEHKINENSLLITEMRTRLVEKINELFLAKEELKKKDAEIARLQQQFFEYTRRVSKA